MRDRARERRLGLEDPDAACRAIWHDAAAELGARVTAMSGGFLEISRNGSTTRVWRHHVMLDDLVTQRLALDKALVHRMLTAERLPVPAYVEFDVSDTRAPLEFLERGGTPCA